MNYKYTKVAGRIEVTGSLDPTELVDFVEKLLRDAGMGQGACAVDCGDAGESTCVVDEGYESRTGSIDCVVFDANLPIATAHTIAAVTAMLLNVPVVRENPVVVYADRGDETFAVHADGSISRPKIGMGCSGQWRITGAVERNNFGRVVRRYSLAEVLEGADRIEWRHKNGNQKTFITDYDHGSGREWVSPSYRLYRATA